MTDRIKTALIFSTGSLLVLFVLLIVLTNLKPGYQNLQLSPINNELANWTNDYKILGCNSNRVTSFKIESFSCIAVSPSSKQIRNAIITVDDKIETSQKVTLSTPIDVETQFISSLENIDGYNNLSGIKPLADLLAIIDNNKSETQSNDVEFIIQLGQITYSQFGQDMVWQVDYFNPGVQDPIKSIYIDALTLEVRE